MSPKTQNKVTPQFDNTMAVDEFKFEEIKSLCNHRINMMFVYKAIVILCKDNNIEMTDNGFFVQSVGDTVNVYSQNEIYNTCFKGFNLSNNDKKQIKKGFMCCIDLTPLLNLFRELGGL